MSWYYAENNERRGPVQDAAFQSLVSAGTIKPDTLVWREGFAAWTPYGSVPATPEPTSSSPVGVAGPTSSGTVVCSQCRRLFPADETVAYEGQHVCAECKPLFFQKIKEGAVVTGQREYAGFWIRFCATFIDWVLINIAGRFVGLIVGLMFGTALGGGKEAVNVAVGVTLLVLLVSIAAYSIIFVGKFGATPGKMACKLQVIRADGSSMTYKGAAGRFLAGILSVFTLYIGFIIAAFDEEKRSLQDRICDTRVIRKPGR